MKHVGATVDFNKILTVLNVLVAALLAVAFFSEQNNEYVNQQTLLLGLVLSLETHVALLLERKRRDPFVILLAFATILYYSLRLYTLTLYAFSIVFERFAYDADDSNYALLFIIVANVFLYAGLFLARSRTSLDISSGAAGRRPNFPVWVLLLMLATFALTYLGGRWGEDAPRPIAVLVVFLSPPIIVAMTLVYYFLFKGSLSRKFAIATGVLILLEIVAHTLFGSRSALVGLVQSCILVALAIWGHIKLRRSVVITGIALLPVGAVLLVAAFTISTYNRAAKDSGGYTLDVRRALDLASDAGSELSTGPALDVLIPPVAARAGFFDFSAEIIAHRDKYRTVINLPAYAKSVIDNILTPGFDVFDQPKIANSLLFVYRDWGLPSKEQVSHSDVYQSDQLGIYGEFYALFGYACLPLLFLMTYFLKVLYTRIDSADPFIFAMKRIIVLSIFTRSVDSFGVDWTIGEVLPLVVATFFYAPLFTSKPAVASTIAPLQPKEAAAP